MIGPALYLDASMYNNNNHASKSNHKLVYCAKYEPLSILLH